MKKYALLAFAMLMSASAFAQEAVSGPGGDKGMYALGLAIMLGLGVYGATSGQAKVGAAAMEGLARNPQARNSMFVPMIVVLALIESLFILTWLIAQGMSGKI
jgi:F-type H+-transporting ATPase subunit c